MNAGILGLLTRQNDGHSPRSKTAGEKSAQHENRDIKLRVLII